MLIKALLITVSLMSLVLLPAEIIGQTANTENQGASRIRIRGKDYGYFYPDSRWPSEKDRRTIIFVCWENGVLSAFPDETMWVQSAIEATWQKYSLIEFRGWKQCAERNRGIRIAVYDDGQPEHQPHVDKIGKYLDKIKGGMKLNFTFRTWNHAFGQSEEDRMTGIRTVAVHEFGHALGFAHEQTRADAPGECSETGTAGAEMLTPYDPESVMNSCNPPEHAQYYNRGKLSALDVESIQQKYGVRGR